MSVQITVANVIVTRECTLDTLWHYGTGGGECGEADDGNDTDDTKQHCNPTLPITAQICQYYQKKIKVQFEQQENRLDISISKQMIYLLISFFSIVLSS